MKKKVEKKSNLHSHNGSVNIDSKNDENTDEKKDSNKSDRKKKKIKEKEKKKKKNFFYRKTKEIKENTELNNSSDDSIDAKHKEDYDRGAGKVIFVCSGEYFKAENSPSISP